ncbi:fumarylacetoacetate (FAA) hydrolase [Sphaerisporangium melleum]|uniref:Fumarylacetoacetate (FAA) hydrolase n=1 Tax=Sphaerisporangium melleum TaxID=321316 RepID=A0A917RRW3_9ACTN|nr:fumarylacetoacetate hydrolase family protein [Sphaerisporangium melleum]GGL20334.1 fumarylacetoacetate (FAA) hydrolase [Sphaerisporangium melleum]GII74857.1 fumarylacetoacetate (FAA) hydrolase [Sphaerisporangium melleum]
MNIIRYRTRASHEPLIGLHDGESVTELVGVASLAELWALPLAELRARLAAGPLGEPVPAAEAELLAPVDGRTEVWAAGVTYEISREARVEESEQAASVYDLVYDAERPELFFKSPAWRAVGPGGTLSTRTDSTVDVPEPELALVVNRLGEIVGYTVCNDMSSRSIEGENPLYLPQAKIFFGACGLGPWIRPAWEIADPHALSIDMAIHRNGVTVWRGAASTSRLRRRLPDLVAYLMRGDVHPDGVILSTGTCLVPPFPFTLASGDVIEIGIGEVGVLRNPVARGLPDDVPAADAPGRTSEPAAG